MPARPSRPDWMKRKNSYGGSLSWVAWKAAKAVSYTPGVGWGRVTIRDTGIGVRFVVSRFIAGESLRSIATDYDLKPAQIENAVRVFVAALRGSHGEKVELRMREFLNADQSDLAMKAKP